MPFRFHIDPEARMLHVVGEGAISQTERLETMRAWIRHPDFRPGLDTLCDFSRATSAPDLADLRQIVALINQHAAAIGNKKLAMIVTAPLTFGAARQFQSLAEATPLDVRVFRDRDGALGWLRPDRG
jgi:hypothetical protein